MDPGSSAALLAGRVGEWTFVYDDSGCTFEDAAEALSADGRTGATSVFSINGDASFTYAVDGKQIAWAYVDGLALLAGLPLTLSALRQVPLVVLPFG
ncbi:hypothetical protein ACFYNN_32200 [Streptomyces sp. NPDC006978]|uniref:hypothetical protein n=1 Tax=unclassified Streptomyces TaxID=2593676 RepID=UPI002AFFB38F|nr:hypothetical protein [Streptomyces sp. S584]